MRRALAAAVAACGLLATGSASAAVTFTFSGTLDQEDTFGPDGAAMAADVGLTLPLAWTATLTFADQPSGGNHYDLLSYSVDAGSLSFSGTSSDPGFGNGRAEGSGLINDFTLLGDPDDFAPSVPGDEQPFFGVSFAFSSEVVGVSTNASDYLDAKSLVQLGVNNASSDARYGHNLGPQSGWDSQVTGVSISGAFTTIVPEPATWALMIAGFGVAGGALRKRRALA